MDGNPKKPIFRDLTAEDPEPEATEIESLCVNCMKNGTTRLLLTRIPFYREVILMSFECEDCGYRNNEIQSGGEIADRGCKITVEVKDVQDLNRKVVKSDYSSIKIVELDFEIPSQSQKGEITTIEGILERSIKGLEQEQTIRRAAYPDVAVQIDEFCDSLRKLKDGKEPFTFILEDMTGNCHVENPNAPAADPQMTVNRFLRTEEQNHQLGIYTQAEVGKEKGDDGNFLLKMIEEDEWPLEELQGEVLQFSTLCPECRSPCETNMKMTSIPHFKEVVIMATVCDVCGCKTNEVKSGSGIEEFGVRIEVKITGREDLSRDVLKSDTCGLVIPEIDCEVGPSALGGRFTTVEGILEAMKKQLSDGGETFVDSTDDSTKRKFDKFISTLEEIIAGRKQITLILDDPAGNSYVQSLVDGDEADEALKITKYTRTFDQNEELGLNDMKTENYGEEFLEKEAAKS
ncbi:zinc finger protein ZPR1 [Phlebotomus argentipes]|uniref:zinc finger protein ZPR1 n=1 Tax=Phlebotomus argentipes TaxID=94469 RepID=UPI0028931BC3|nr:zinc finger protein ZPR1 [Phlebotomus argentipes]